MSELDRSEALRRLEQHGKQFMLQFDDYESNEESEPEVEQDSSSDEEVNNTMLQTSTTKLGPQKPVIQQPKTTIFFEPGLVSTSSSIEGHKSLDGKEDDVAVTARDKVLLKRKRQEEAYNRDQEYSKELKKLKKGPAFEVENNPTLMRKNERQREMDSIAGQIKEFVFKQTLNQEDYDKRMDEELRSQGRFYQRETGRKVAGAVHMNLKEFKEMRLKEKQENKLKIKEAKQNGTFDKKKARIEFIKNQSKRENDRYAILSRYGAPSDIGKADKRVRNKASAGSIGNWSKGTLHIGKRDLLKITGGPKPKSKFNKK
ncbi:hypothetical protein AKO1_001223, partial [Acrasis kona]